MNYQKVSVMSLLAVALALLTLNSAWAYDNPGTSVRGVGMGGSFAAVADDPSAAFCNPAGLIWLKGWNFYLMYDRKTIYGVDSSESPYLGAGVVTVPLSRDITIALGGYQDGSWTDPTAITTKNLGLLSFSSWVTDQFSVGFNLKGLYNSNFGQKSGFDFDLGFLYWPSSAISIGFVGGNLLRTDMAPDNPLDASFGYETRHATLGLAYHYQNRGYGLCLALDNTLKDVAQPQNKTYNLTHIGMEHWISANSDLSLGLRGGYGFGKDYELDFGQLSLGASLRLEMERSTVQLDWAWSGYPYQSNEELAGDHRVGLIFSWQVGVKRGEKLIIKEEKKQEEEKPIEIRPTQVIPGEPDEYPAKPEPEYPPKEIDSAAVSPEVLTYQLKSEIEYLSVGKNRSIMFLLRPELMLEIEKWKLYIWSNQPTGWSKDQTEQSLLKTFEGWGVPSFGVMWDCTSNNVKAKRGTYFYALVLKDNQGKKWYSQIKSFKLD